MAKFKSEFLQEMDARGFLNQSTDWDGLDRHLMTPGRTAYLGCDPSADSLHVGHLVPVMMMRWFQKFGHKPILLVGGATGFVGDPDKDTERPMLDAETIAANVAGLKKSYAKFLKFDGDDATIMVDNYDWFKDVGYLKFLREVGSVVSVNKLISLDRIKKRLDQELHLSFLELNYPLMQSYDFLVLNRQFGCDIQICGADQWGNAIGGVDLIRRKQNADAFVLSSPLLLDANGKKMGKTTGNAAWVNDERATAFEYYQFFRNTDDSLVGKLLRLYTELPLDEIAKLEKLQGSDINEAKKILAFHATAICRGEIAAQAAADAAAALFGGGGNDAAMPEVFVKIDAAVNVVDFVVSAGLFPSKGEARRVIEQGGLQIDGKKVADVAEVVLPKPEYILQRGKKVFVKVKS